MEHKPKEGMIDNRMIDDNHQQGIKRVLQRGHDRLDYEGHYGSMKAGWKHGKDGKQEGRKVDSFKRNDGQLTPRKA